MCETFVFLLKEEWDTSVCVCVHLCADSGVCTLEEKKKNQTSDCNSIPSVPCPVPWAVHEPLEE